MTLPVGSVLCLRLVEMILPTGQCGRTERKCSTIGPAASRPVGGRLQLRADSSERSQLMTNAEAHTGDTPIPDELQEAARQLSNWGKWGPDDELAPST